MNNMTIELLAAICLAVGCILISGVIVTFNYINKNKHIHHYFNQDKPILVSGYGRSQYAIYFCKCGHPRIVQNLSIDGDWLGTFETKKDTL